MEPEAVRSDGSKGISAQTFLALGGRTEGVTHGSLTWQSSVATMNQSRRDHCDHKLEHTMASLSMGIREAKTNLSRLLRMVEKGSEIVLTDRGRPVGKIVPFEREGLSLTSRMRAMEEAGTVEPTSGKSLRSLPSPIPIQEGMAQKLLREDREGVSHGD